tara:strand:- start:604 stop:870 length:267 start_codon:yes stop_codon:yes gene_type:complete
MGACYLCCENDRGTFAYYCEKCNNIKRLISLYGLDRVYDILQTVLVRTRQQQQNKIKGELEKEKEIVLSKSEEHKLEEKLLRSGAKRQ